MSVLAFDLGASSGRAFVGRLEDGGLRVEEIRRFPNDPVQVGRHLHWDILRLFHEVKQGILQASRLPDPPRSIGIDSWAVDFGLIGENGELLGNPYHYRDNHTDGIMDEVFAQVPAEEIFARTGIQFMQINTLFQLVALKKNRSPFLAQAKRLLMIPDLLRYFLTGLMKSEYTNATTTQLYNPAAGGWDVDLIRSLGLPDHLFGEVVDPGTVIGDLSPQVCRELNGIKPVPVFAVCEHDTGSAVVSVPAAGESFAYLICGTWSLLGTELKNPVLSPRAREWNFTNEGGIGRTARLLKNIMGLWLLEECRRVWEKEGRSAGFDRLLAAAENETPFRSLIDPDHPRFLNPPHMPEEIQAFCRETGQPVPVTEGQMVRCILESLALKFRLVLERTEQLAGCAFSGLHMLGGGIHNTLLAQFTANSIGRPVWAGPAEASAIGNILVQLMALGEIRHVRQARQIVRESFPLRTYEPRESGPWEEAYETFLALAGKTGGR